MLLGVLLPGVEAMACSFRFLREDAEEEIDEVRAEKGARRSRRVEERSRGVRQVLILLAGSVPGGGTGRRGEEDKHGEDLDPRRVVAGRGRRGAGGSGGDSEVGE